MISTIASAIGPLTSVQSHINTLSYAAPKNNNIDTQIFDNYSFQFSYENVTQYGGDVRDIVGLFQNGSFYNSEEFDPKTSGTEQIVAGFAEAIGNGTNSTDYPQIPAYIRTTSMIFCIVIMCLGVVGNVMVPIVIMKTKDMRNSTNIFLMNLSIADLMVLLVCTPTVLVEVNTRPETWVLGKEMCLAVPFVELTVAHASVLTILAISFERYYAICEPLKAGYVCTKTRAALICFLAWFVAAVFTSPILAVAEYRQLEYHDGTTVPSCRTPVASFWPTLYFFMTISLFFLVPFIILLALYTIIAKNLISAAAKVVMNKHVDCYNLRARRQVVIMLGTVILSFFICLMPFKVFTLWILIVSDESIDKLGIETYYNILYFSRTMLYLNSAVNPVLYNLMSSKFRDGFLLVCRLKKKHELRSYRRGCRERLGTFRTTSSYTTSSSLSRQSTSSKITLHRTYNPEQRRCSTFRPHGLKRGSFCRSCESCHFENDPNTVQIQPILEIVLDEVEDQINGRQTENASPKKETPSHKTSGDQKSNNRKNFISQIVNFKSFCRNRRSTHTIGQELTTMNGKTVVEFENEEIPKPKIINNEKNDKDSSVEENLDYEAKEKDVNLVNEYCEEKQTGKQRDAEGEQSSLLLKQRSLDSNETHSNYSLRKSVLLKSATNRSLDERNLNTFKSKSNESFV